LCRDHHLDLHRYGNETAWWANLQIVPTEAAKDLWQTTLLPINRQSARHCRNRVTEATTGLIQGGEKARHRYRKVCDLLAAQPTNSPIKQTPASYSSP
jgi:hypothetical protein